MKIRFIGTDDPTDNAVCDVFGLTFNKGEWVDLSDVPAALLTNPTFEVKAAKASAAAPAADAPLAYDGMKVADLKALAAERGVDLGDAAKKADIIAALELHDETPSAEVLPPE